MALPRQLKEIAFGSGLNTKGDERAQPEQLLDIGVNVEFDDVGDLRCRFPFDNVRTALVGGGTLADPRKLAMLGDELVCFTKTALYAWIPAESAWQYRGDHLAVATDEETVFAAPGDQDYADRAELNGQIVYCWSTTADGVCIAVRDKASGAVIQGKTKVAPAGRTYIQPRLVALDTCVLLFCIDFAVPPANTTLVCAKITLSPYAYTAAGAPIATVTGAPATFHYDVCRIPGQDRCYAALVDSGAPTGYTITSVDSAFAGAQTTGVTYSSPSSNPIAIAVSPDAAFCTVINTAGDRIYADIWNVTAAGVQLTQVAGGFQIRLDASPATQVGSTSQATAAYRLTQDGGHYRCYVFWSRDENAAVPASTVFESCSNWIDATGAVGADAPFVYGLGIGARAFAHDSHVYLIGTFAGLSFAGTDPSGTHSELQNTYYLYRDDGFLVAKAVWGEGGGFHVKGWLPSVVADAASADALVFMAGIRRIVSVGKNNASDLIYGVENYAERAPREVTFTFDDDRARRCVQVGETLYVLGGLILQYDGAQLTELGFCTYPWWVFASLVAGGSVEAGGYSYKATDRWTNGKGETDRSTTATVTNFTLAAPNSIEIQVPNLYVTRKTGVALEVWRTAKNPALGAPFFLATSQDPSVTNGNNKYLTSDPTSSSLAAVTDALVDADLTDLTANPENGAVLPNIEPPPASIAYTDGQRIYLAGIPGYPNTVYYSKYRQAGLVAAFNDALAFDVPADTGAITALGMLDGSLIVWCETGTYAFAGAGFDDTGAGSNFELARTLSKDVGCVGPEAIALYESAAGAGLQGGDGYIVKTSKGWWELSRMLRYSYIGQGVAKYDAETVKAMTVLTARHQVRVLTSGRILVFDTLVKEWAETSISDGLDMLLWNGTPAYLNATGVRAELATWNGYAGTDASLTQMDVELGWIKFGAMQARAIVDAVQLLGEYRSTCAIRVRLGRDYQATAEGVWNYHTDKTWAPSPTTVGSALQLKQGLRYRRCEALKVRLTITAPDGVSPLGGPCARLTSLAIPHAIEPNAYSALAAAQKN